MLNDLIARLLGGGSQNALASVARQPVNALVRPFQAADMFAPSNPNSMPRMPASAQQLPASAPSPRPAQDAASPAQASPAPVSGGGIGDLLGNLLMPQRAQRNQTVQWLQSQGLDAGTAELLAGNKSALQQYLLERTRGTDPMDALRMQKTLLEIEQMRNPTTDDVREYQFARQQGYEGSFTDFMKEMRQAGATQVNVGPTGIDYGTPPKDHVWARNPDGTVKLDERGAPIPLPVGPALQDEQARERAEENKDEQQKLWNAIVDEEIGKAFEIMDEANLPTTGALGDFLSGIGGTAARNLRARLETIKAHAGFDRLQAMRDASPTGAVLGQITERELAFLQATIGNLDQAQTIDQLRYNLERIRRIYQNVLSGKRAYEGILDEQPDKGAPDASEPPQPRRSDGKIVIPRVGSIEDGYRFKGGNPANPENWERVQ